MTAPVRAPATGDEEALCSDCVVNKGLCHFHECHVLPQIALPSWPRMIGEPYVCTDPAHEDHTRCVHSHGPAPRGECSCHHCSQKRWERLRSRTDAELTVSPQQLAHQERKRVARKPKGRVAGGRRLVSALQGGFSRSRRAASA